MFTYKDILKDKYILDCFTQIDENNNYYYSHGLKHALNVLKTCKDMSKFLKLDKNTTNNLLISAVLHDISCKDGRKEHPKRSSEFAKEYLKSKLPNEDIEQIAYVISTHSEEIHQDLLNGLLYFADKIDVSKKRLEDGYEKKYNKFTLSENVLNVLVKLKNDNLNIIFKTTNNLKLEDYIKEFPNFLEFNKFIANKISDAINKPVKIIFGNREI